MSLTPFSSSEYAGIQVLRFVAALFVVIHHATGMIAERMDQSFHSQIWIAGAAGVDIFFVISGFVMYISSTKLQHKPNGWLIFARNRLVRIAPLYWFATALKILLVLLLPALALRTTIDANQVLTSLLFIPTFEPHTHELIEPILKVGWTLTYEMFFYLTITFALLFRLSPLGFASLVFAAGMAAGQFFLTDVTYLNGFMRPILLEFLMGMLIGKFLAGRTVPGWAAWAIGGLGTATILLVQFPIELRWIYWGIPSAAIVAALVLTERSLKVHTPRFLVTLGESSYSLYLFHTFLIPAVGVVFVKAGLENEIGFALATAIVGSIALGLAVHKLIEIPVTTRLRSFANPAVATLLIKP